MTTPEVVAMLAALDPAAIDWHAARYDSATHFQALIALALPPSNLKARELREHVRTIAQRCKDDGAEFGFIPCLAGEHRRAWFEIRGWALGF